MKLIIPPPNEPMESCPNVGCTVGETSTRMVDHLKMCGWQEIECPCPGCYETMPRMLVQAHLEQTVRVHVENARLLSNVQAYELADLREYNAKLLDIINEIETTKATNAFIEQTDRVCLGDFQYSAASGRVVPLDRNSTAVLSSEDMVVDDHSDCDTQVA
jgi:hypothetical protein